MYFVNLENHSVSFQVLFFRDDGGDLSVPVLGQGVVRGLNVSLDTAGSIKFVPGSFDDDAAFDQLAQALEELRDTHGIQGNAAFYLSIPPSMLLTSTQPFFSR